MRRESGVSLIELMVAMVVGMVAMVSIYQMSRAINDYQRYNLGGSGAQMNGSVGIMQLQTDLQRSGAGISHLSGLGCTVISSQLANFPLVPALIQTPAGAASDNLTVLYGTSAAGASYAFPDKTHAAIDTQFSSVFGAVGYLPGDMVIATSNPSPPILPCPLFQVTAVTQPPVIANCGGFSTALGTEMNSSVCHATSSNWNTPSPFPAQMIGDQRAAPTKLFNFGRMVRRTYCVYLIGNPNICPGAPAALPDGSLISMDALNANTALPALPTQTVPLDGAWQVVVENVVQMKLEYGIDAASAGNFSVTAWQAAAPANWNQLVALRFALLVRGSNPQRPDSGGGCADNATHGYTAATKADAFTNPAAAYYLGWSTANLANQFITPANADWQCYRYSVHENIVELRNMRSIIQSNL